MNNLLKALLISLPLAVLSIPTAHAEESPFNLLLSELPALPTQPEEQQSFSYLPSVSIALQQQASVEKLLRQNIQLQNALDDQKEALRNGQLLLNTPKAFGSWFYALSLGLLLFGVALGYSLGRLRSKPQTEPVMKQEETPDAPLVTEEKAPLPMMKSKAALDTLLNLSQTYTNMGDPDTAKQFLDEVLEFGDDEQKRKAESIADITTAG